MVKTAFQDRAKAIKAGIKPAPPSLEQQEKYFNKVVLYGDFANAIRTEGEPFQSAMARAYFFMRMEAQTQGIKFPTEDKSILDKLKVVPDWMP